VEIRLLRLDRVAVPYETPEFEVRSHCGFC
jgi:hypothetical protein